MLDRSFIDEYEQGSAKVSRAIAGLSRDDLSAVPIPGKWSIQQVVIHLADTEQVLAERMKRIIAEKTPTYAAFDENRWSQDLHYGDQSADDAAKLIEMVRKQLSRVLKKLPDETFARQGKHSEVGPQTLQSVIEKATSHLDHHLKFLAEKREKLGK